MKTVNKVLFVFAIVFWTIFCIVYQPRVMWVLGTGPRCTEVVKTPVNWTFYYCE